MHAKLNSPCRLFSLDVGRQVSEWCERNMPNYLTNALAQGRAGELLNKITDAYRACDQQLVSPTTCTCRDL